MQQRTSNWRARLMMEASTNGCHAFMVTFTYDDSHLPIVSGNLSTNHYFRSYDPKNQYSVYYHKDFWTDEVYVDYPVQCKKDIQNFNKRLRITIQRQNLDIKYRYFIVAEYGPKTYRPHYHGIFFVYGYDWKKFNKNLIEKTWKNGFVDISLCRDSVKLANYVAGYVSINKQHPYDFDKCYSNGDRQCSFTPIRYNRRFNNTFRDHPDYNTFYLFSNRLGKETYTTYWEDRIKNNLDKLKKSNVHLQNLIYILVNKWVLIGGG